MPVIKTNPEVINSDINIKTILQNSRLPRLESQMLLQHILNVDRAWLIAHDTDLLSSNVLEAYNILQTRRLNGEPMAYIIGQREFMGFIFKVNASVLIPRPETELLVETAIKEIADIGYDSIDSICNVLDLGTGSGAIAVSIALNAPDAIVTATDISKSALKIAQLNADNLDAKVQFLHSNWYDDIPDGAVFDVIVSNPPYIAAGDVHLSQGDLRFEPIDALTDKSSGLTALHIIISQAPRFLNSGGLLLVEHGWDQSSMVQQYMRLYGFRHVNSLKDLAGIPRVTMGQI